MRSYFQTFFFLIPLLCLTSTCLTSCGSSSSDSSSSSDTFDSSATVKISADPSAIDIDDITQVTVDISEVNSNGLALKIRFPDSLTYIPNTSVLTHNVLPVTVTPTIDSKKSHAVYLVYYLSRSMFGDSNDGKLQLQLKGIHGLTSGIIEVDPDVDDPAIDNATEFDINNPHFEPDDSTKISIQS